ncbi:4'-phosphopantetheinyl transferase superfamily protein [Ralstonia solanacearum]|uniref:4'-phosphopantetheinyl transferase family protein n=1 Tax=Ralstonia solanacearum TaxID=305 RepID=UPI0018C28A9D|nr:4'-phosphopantetheinyl transferase superfamily protein [Ralstonia solanacearum]MDB0544468.1 4'-phosphopantetheinyl transferase superfamily protein [Ralstonia solanacearum]MDB0554278.1 4'-phosphopantetheinyl transferase superfamily protein [Ralstonia solanacearum]MDB0559389.1 4'-phosphopantetheinyl transferase superfamily protein [Ralstonia solanacearum]
MHGVLNANVAHLWQIELGPLQGLSAADWELLSPDEKIRVNRLRFEADRLRWIRTRAAVRRVLSRYCGVPAHQLKFESGQWGKPRLCDDVRSLEFNLGHSNTCAVVVLTQDNPVGIDIELEDEPLVDGMERTILCDRERATWLQLPPSDRRLALVRAWCAKEACVKAAGVGLAGDAFAIDTGLGRHRFCTTREGQSWHMHEIACVPEHVVTIASLHPVSQIAFRQEVAGRGAWLDNQVCAWHAAD